MPESEKQGEKPALMTEKQLANYISVCRQTISRGINEGTIPPEAKVKIGKRAVRYRRDIIDAWIRKRSGGNAAPL
ncbi:MAG: helix-turn-helix domain-containing protein [Planctomycetota bacterium]|jgi:predicted DNA-binding transcriptional regulator AlpA|nr:helix-turn-helix domain-containing protein [Planctomycetota bacterium]